MPWSRVILVAGLVLLGCDSPDRGELDRDASVRTPSAADGEADPATREGGERSRGLEGGAVDGTAPPIRVVFLGTSLTAGLGVAADEAYPTRIGALANGADLDVEIVNAGLSGDTSAGGRRRLEWVLAQGAEMLVIELGANDGLRGLSPEALEENLRAIVLEARKAEPGIRIVLAGMEAPPNMGDRYADRFRETYPAVAEELDLVLIPFLLDGVAGVPALNQADRIHPNSEGHRRMAEAVVWPVLEPLLRDIRAERDPVIRDPT